MVSVLALVLVLLLILISVVVVLLLISVNLDKLESIERNEYNDISTIKSNVKFNFSINKSLLRKLVPLMKALIDWISDDQDL